MAERAFDVVVVGSGPGGYVTAIRAAQLGLKTACVERDQVGGRCLNYACIPAKATLRVADALSEVRGAGDLGIQVAEPSIDMAGVVEHRAKVISTLTGGVSMLFKKHGVELVEGDATLTGGKAVQVGDDTLTASTAVVLATGSVPRALPGVEFSERIIDTERGWGLSELPSSIAIAGAGASGSELASCYARLGVETHLLEALDQVVPLEDKDIARVVERGLKKQGVKVHTGVKAEEVEETGSGVRLKVGGETLEVDLLCIAAGRGPDVDGLGLEAAGVTLGERGLIDVDDRLRTKADGIYAIGDLVPGPALAHKASDEGIIAVEDAAGKETHPLVHVDIPRATFCSPQVGSFGLTEAQAKEQGYDVVVGKVPYGAVGAGTVTGDRNGMIKVVGETKYGELLGGHIVGGKATELVQELVNAKALEGGFSEVARIVHGHPTLSEGVMEAARAADGWLIHG